MIQICEVDTSHNLKNHKTLTLWKINLVLIISLKSFYLLKNASILQRCIFKKKFHKKKPLF